MAGSARLANKKSKMTNLRVEGGRMKWDPVDIALVISILMVGIIGSSSILLLVVKCLLVHKEMICR